MGAKPSDAIGPPETPVVGRPLLDLHRHLGSTGRDSRLRRAATDGSVADGSVAHGSVADGSRASVGPFGDAPVDAPVGDAPVGGGAA